MLQSSTRKKILWNPHTFDNDVLLKENKLMINVVIADAAAGGSDDYAMAVAGANLSYTIELPGGRYGFAPPPKEIEPVGRETFEAILVFAKYVERKIIR